MGEGRNPPDFFCIKNILKSRVDLSYTHCNQRRENTKCIQYHFAQYLFVLTDTVSVLSRAFPCAQEMQILIKGYFPDLGSATHPAPFRFYGLEPFFSHPLPCLLVAGVMDIYIWYKRDPRPRTKWIKKGGKSVFHSTLMKCDVLSGLRKGFIFRGPIPAPLMSDAPYSCSLV